MSKLTAMHATILNLSEKVQAEANRFNPDLMVSMALACEHMAKAYQRMREVEIHEEFHMSGGHSTDGPDFILPGEGGPIEGGGSN